MKGKNMGDYGTASFAMLGVLIILLSIIATAHISRLERLNYEERFRTDLLTKMDNLGEEYLDSIDTKLHMLGIKSAFNGNRVDTDPPYYLFEKGSEDYFEEVLGEEIKDGSFSMTLVYHNVSMGNRIMEVDDVLLQPVDPKNTIVDGPGEMVRTNRTYCYEIDGVLKVLVRDTRRDTELRKEREVDLTVDVPYPFIKERTISFSGSGTGSQGHIARMVEYMLTTVAQYRVFMGERDTEVILTNEDVELAVNLALILEIAYQFRYHDEGVTRALSENVSHGAVDLIQLMEHYIQTNRVDPGDIIAIYHGYAYDGDLLDNENATLFNISGVISQALYAIVDQFILNYLDYFGMLDIVDIAYRAYRKVCDWAEEGTSYFKGLFPKEDKDEINPEHVDLVKNWVHETFVSAGLMNTHISRSVYHPIDSIDGETITGYPSLPEDFSHEFTFNTTVKITGKEYRYYEYACDCPDNEPHLGYQGKMCENEITIDDPVLGNMTVTCGAQEELVGYQYATYPITVSVGPGQFFFHEIDILKSQDHDELWQDFFDNKFTDEGDNEVNSTREALVQIINRIVESVINNIELEEEDYKLHVNPGDRVTLFNEIKNKVNLAVSTAFGEFRDNPDFIANIVRDYLHGDENGGKNIEALMDLLNESYDTFADKNQFIRDAVNRTADILLRPENPGLVIEIGEPGIRIGELGERADLSWNTSQGEIPRGMVSRLLREQIEYDDFIDSLGVHAEIAYQELKKREVDRGNHDIAMDGMIVQALHHYQHSEGIYTREILDDSYGVRSKSVGETQDLLNMTIEPNPAVQGKDIIYFNATIEESNFINWTSDRDGFLSDDQNFTRSAEDLTYGTHIITINWFKDGIGVVSETMELHIIRFPPRAVIDEVGPWWEKELLTFTHSSDDPFGNISGVYWDFGDGNSSTGDTAEHAYERPGIYKVTLTVTNDVGLSNSTWIELLIDDRPYVKEFGPDTSIPLGTDTALEITFSEKVAPDTLEYIISPSMEMTEEGGGDNSTVILRPKEFFQRRQDYVLMIVDVRDVDNGTASPLLEEYTIEFETVDFARLEGWHPGGNDVPVNREVVLGFTEGVTLTGSVHGLISGDHDWKKEISNDGRTFKLFHEPFPSGSTITLTLNLGELRASRDNSSILCNEGNTNVIISFTTRDVSYPQLIRAEPVNTMDVPVNQSILMEFDTPVNVSSFELSISPELDNMTLHWSDENRILEITHQGMTGDTLYIVWFSGEDMRGRPIIPDLNNPDIAIPFMFNTVDTFMPSVVHYSPHNDMKRFLSGAPVTLVFNKPMNTSSLRYHITGGDGEYTTIWNDMGTTIYIGFSGYSAGEWYTFHLLGGEDTRGNELQGLVDVRYRISLNGDEIEGTWFERKVWSIMGGGLGTFGSPFFDMGEEFLMNTVSNMINSSQFSQLEYRVPLNVDETFTYEETGELELKAILEPSFLHLRGEEGLVKLAGGTHYTDITKISSRPYETHWTISVPESRVVVNVSRIGHGVVLDGAYKEVQWKENMDVGFTINVSVSSGWELEDVDYGRSDSFLRDIKSFLNNVWKYLKDAIGYIIGGIQRLLELFDSLVERIKEFGQEIMILLGEMIQRVVMQLREYITGKGDDIIEIIDSLASITDIETISMLGLDFHIDTGEAEETTVPMHPGTVTRYLNISLQGEFIGTHYTLNLNMLEDNIIAFGDLSVRNMVFQWVVDPFADPFNDMNDENFQGLYDAWFQCNGRVKNGNTELELKVPVMADDTSSHTVALSDVTKFDNVRIPIGPIVISDLDMGMELVYDGSDIVDILKGLLYTAFQDTRTAMKGVTMGLNYVVEFVRTLVRNMISGFIEIARDYVKELIFFFEGAINEVEVKLFFSMTSGEAIVGFINWVVQTVKELIQGFIDMRPALPSSLPSTKILQNTTFGVEVGKGDLVGYFNADVPTLSAAVGRPMGDWNLGFGVNAPEMTLVQGQLTGG
ncbi:MAG: PKD domain-containing protein [Thermoplasmata archaeon]